MKWFKIHKSLTFMVLSFVLSLGFSSIFFADSSYAASQSFDYTSNPSRGTVLFDSSNNTLGFIPVYLTVENINTGSCQIMSLYNLVQVQMTPQQTTDLSPPQVSDCSFYLSSTLNSGFLNLKYMSYSFPSGGFRLTLYDSIPGSSCPTCPEIPETPYGDKLDKIYIAILAGSGTILFVYFMFCMYQMFFGGLKK